MIKLVLSLLAVTFLSTPLFARDELIVRTNQYLIGETEFLDKQMILFEGEMAPSSMSILSSVMKERNITDLAINSFGGQLDEAFVLGKYIAENHVSVYIPKGGVCVSSCAFAIMRSDSIINDGNGILFHPPYLVYLDPRVSIEDVLKQNEIVTLDMVNWFADSGYSVDLLDIIYRHANRQKFIVFQDPKFLYEFKVNEFTTKVEIKPEWFKIEER